ncbi:expressed unknown protein [Seminavis robusta]|uniref:Uncharacterized protein n=1 Tax=Seminavis robusta TaxID=568900 RepID=A0A9N8E4W2_9STRA|nr:expressed unknown protein [Seminavis robusta]|eukprot:Sro662_g183320.1 n/a (606) ;mRNA; f:11612-13429
MTTPIVSYSDIPWKKHRKLLLAIFAVALVVVHLANEAGKLLLLPWDASTSASLSSKSIAIACINGNSTTGSSHSKEEATEKMWKSHKLQAAVALRVMEERDIMTTPFSSRELALQKTFPSNLQWTPCALERIFQQKLKKHNNQGTPIQVNIAVVGGSTAARPGDRCARHHSTTTTVTTTKPDGRHSGQLHQKLNQEFIQHQALLDTTRSTSINTTTTTTTHDNLSMKFQVYNCAQGGTNTVTSAMLMDGCVNAANTDIIIWDFLVNDEAGGGGTKEENRKMDFWLTRVHAHFAKAGKPPPPIVLLHLWGDRAMTNVNKYKGKRKVFDILDRKPHRYLGRLLTKYIESGWDIAMINVAAAINGTALSQNVKLLLDETTHASCAGTSLMGDMIQHLFYTNVASESCTLQNALTEPPPQPVVPLPHSLREPKMPSPISEAKWTPLWHDLFREDARIGSLSVWKPVEANLTNLHLLPGWQATIDSWPTRLTAKHRAGRFDIKNGLVLPECANTTQMLNFYLQEPDLKWLGFNMKGGERHVYVNGMELLEVKARPHDWCFGFTQISHWVNLKNYTAIRLPEDGIYTISFCHTTPTKATEPTLSFFIGVAV